MATSSRQASLFGLQDWQRIYQTYRDADFASYDYETLRKSFVDYLTQYYPETFNDYIDSSEFIALLDVIAFMGQSLAFRNDLNARENFIDTAERRDSVIKLANLVSYTPKRNIAGQGLVKIDSVQTSEPIRDINGINLAGVEVSWNDPGNPYWQEQFNTILNSALIDNQRIGRPSNSKTILGVKTDEYTINLPRSVNPVIPYSTVVDDQTMDFELVSVTSVDSENLYELPPAPLSQFNILYRNDGQGFNSNNTGYFIYFKQGTLQAYDFNLPEAIKNNTQAIGTIQGVNNSDTWLYAINAASNAITDLWTQVDTVYSNERLAQTGETNAARNIYTVISGFNDQVSYTFGDGIFGNIPVGNFRAFVRSSNALSYTIDPSEMESIQVIIPYISRNGRQETLTAIISLKTPVNTAQNRESIADIKQRAPTRYYSQNRMVNGEDYSNFPFTLYRDIVKSKAVNRTSIGVSRNQDLLDPTAKYSSINVFADDGAVYVDNTNQNTLLPLDNTNLINDFLSSTLQTILGSSAVLQYYYQNYQRYDGTIQYLGSPVRLAWNQSTVNSDNVTGYFYYQGNTGLIPTAVGSQSSGNTQYIQTDGLVKFVPPVGYHFDRNNRIVAGVANPLIGDKTYIWAGVLRIIGNGSNNGLGNFNDGSGPITLSEYIPTGAYIEQTAGIIPSFDSTIDPALIRTVLRNIDANYNFALRFNNSLNDSADRWDIVYPVDLTNTTATYWIVNFEYLETGEYLISWRSSNYYFASVNQNRFYYDGNTPVFDPKTGQTLRDFVGILKNNLDVSSVPLGNDIRLTIVGQDVEPDGYTDDFSVIVSSVDTRTGNSNDPDFFQRLAGTPAASTRYVYFRSVTDMNNLSRKEVLPVDSVVDTLTLSAIINTKYDYPAGQIFYATDTELYYVNTRTTTGLEIVQNNNYSREQGRDGIAFQYRHNSGESTRIDPGTTNIIDIYLVTQSYYTQYQNWINDTSGQVSQPTIPTVQELQLTYSRLNDFKMLSDTVVLNSVTFKPLFGSKADRALQGTIKVIKNINTIASDGQIRNAVIGAMNRYFDINNWDFGDTFYFSELSAYLHQQLGDLVSSVVLVPKDPTQTFGDLYEIQSRPNEIFVNGATVNDVIVIAALTSSQLQR